MNRSDFQAVSELRLNESKALLAAGLADGAYYLAGYAIECALKACIAKRTQQHDFPEKESRSYYSHNLLELLNFARLKNDFDQALNLNPVLRANWTIVQEWSEESRYESSRTLAESEQLLNAIDDATGGLLPWLRQRW